MKKEGEDVETYPQPLRRGELAVATWEDIVTSNGEKNERVSPPLLKGVGGMKKEGEDVETYPQPL